MTRLSLLVLLAGLFIVCAGRPTAVMSQAAPSATSATSSGGNAQWTRAVVRHYQRCLHMSGSEAPDPVSVGVRLGVAPSGDVVSVEAVPDRDRGAESPGFSLVRSRLFDAVKQPSCRLPEDLTGFASTLYLVTTLAYIPTGATQ